MKLAKYLLFALSINASFAAPYLYPDVFNLNSDLTAIPKPSDFDIETEHLTDAASAYKSSLSSSLELTKKTYAPLPNLKKSAVAFIFTTDKNVFYLIKQIRLKGY